MLVSLIAGYRVIFGGVAGLVGQSSTWPMPSISPRIPLHQLWTFFYVFWTEEPGVSHPLVYAQFWFPVQ